MQHQVVIPTGYMGSGSSAITDLLSEVDGYSCANGNFEYVFMHCPDGVFDLEDKLLLGNTAVRSDEALHSFYQCMKNLYKNRRYWVADYAHKIAPEFLDWCTEFVNSLISEKITASYWYYQENPNFRIYLKKAIAKALKMVSFQKIQMKPGIRYNEMWISYATKEEFYSAAKILIERFFTKMGVRETAVILDQFLLPHNLFRMQNYFEDNCKALVVERDPRDVFLLNKYYWSKANCPVPYSFNVAEFCRNYRKMRLAEKSCDNKNVMRLHFEDLIYRYDTEVCAVFEFLGIREEAHTRKKTKLIPKKSRINTQLFRKKEEYIEEARYIEDQLKEYLYDFPYTENEQITEKNLIL